MGDGRPRGREGEAAAGKYGTVTYGHTLASSTV